MLTGVSNLTNALDYLRMRQLDARHAVANLHSFPESIEVLDLFRRRFRRDYDQVVGSESLLSPSIRVMAQSRFLQLISQHYFPVRMSAMEELRETGYWQLQVIPYQYDWWNCPVDGVEYAHRVILCLAGQYQPKAVYDMYGDAPEDETLEKWLQPVTEDLHAFYRLDELCKDRRDPLRDLALIVEMASRYTGNAWLDAAYGDQGSWQVDWSERNLDELVSDFKKAEQAMRKLKRLSAWLEEDKTRVLKVRKLLVESMEMRQRIQVGVPLIESLKGILD